MRIGSSMFWNVVDLIPGTAFAEDTNNLSPKLKAAYSKNWFMYDVRVPRNSFEMWCYKPQLSAHWYKMYCFLRRRSSPLSVKLGNFSFFINIPFVGLVSWLNHRMKLDYYPLVSTGALYFRPQIMMRFIRLNYILLYDVCSNHDLIR